MKIPFSRPDDDDPVARAARMVFDREPGSLEAPRGEDETPAQGGPVTPPATAATPSPSAPRGTRILVGAALVAILIGAALVAIPALTGDGDGVSNPLPGTWPPDDETRAWTEPEANPEPAGCGEAVGLLIDRSVPVDPGRSVPNLSVTTEAARTYIDAIGITPTPVGFWTFGTYGDPSGEEDFGEATGVVDFPARTPVIVAGVAGRDRRADLEAGLESIPFGFTSSDSDQVELSERNWEAGLRAVHESDDTPRTLVLITTGSPTTRDEDTARQKGVDPVDLDAAVAAANELKANGTRIIAIGVEGADAVALEAISGPVVGDVESPKLGDHYLTDRDGLAATLQQVAAAQCGGTVTVDKRVQELAGDDPIAGEGWEYRLTAAGDPIDDGVTDQNGLVLLGWSDLDGVLLQESGEEGYQLPLDGNAGGESGATCRRAGPDPRVDGLDVPGGVELEVDAGQIIGCTFASVRSYVDLVVDLVPLSKITPPGSTVRYDVTYRNAGTLPASGAVVQFVVPEGATVSADNDHPWRCEGGFPALAGATCTFAHPDGDLEPASPFYAFWLDARIDASTERNEIEAAALILSENLADPVPEDNLASAVTSTRDDPPPTTVPPTTAPPTPTTTTVAPTTTTTTTTSTTTTTTTTTSTTTTTTTSTTTTTTTSTTTTSTTVPPPPPPPTVGPTTTSSSTTSTTTVPPTTSTVPPPLPLSEDLVVEVSSDAAAAGVGSFVDVTIVARNVGDQALDDATLSLVPPPGTDFDVLSSEVGWRCDVLCTIGVGTVPAGDSGQVGATLVVMDPDGRRSIEVASTLQGEAPGGRVAASGSTTVPLATVDVGLTLAAVDEPVAGEVARFEATIVNNGSVVAAEVELDLDLPEPLQLDTLSGSDAASCRPVSGRCRLLQLPPGATEVITGSWSVPRSLPSAQVEVAAQVTTPLADDAPSDNSASLESTVGGIRVEALAAPSGLFDNSDASTWLGIAVAVAAALLIAWIFGSGIRRYRRAGESDLEELPERDAT